MNTDDLKERLLPLVARYPHPQAALAPLLHTLIELQQPLDHQTLAVAAELCGVEARSVAEIVTHYPLLQNDQSKHTTVCFGLPCYLSGAREIFDQIKAGLPPGGTPSCEVMMSSCLGHCYAAPVLKLEDGTVCRASVSTSIDQLGATHG
jgi:NADH:ubiquinone oxidoreductase subunit E